MLVERMAEPIIRTVELVKDFPLGSRTVRVLKGINLEVNEGEFLGLMGPSGSGKSTLLNLIGGLDRPTGGQILVRSIDITSLDENSLASYRRQRIGFVFQSFNLIPTMTALHNVEFPMIFAGVPPKERAARARHLLAQVGLGERLDHRPTELSGGEQQRVAIARALTNDPDILLADEPTGNLDTATGVEVMNLLTRLNAAGRTVLVVTHDPEVAQFAHRLVRLRDGRLEAGG
jgi:putative ABC transport system ATP-binding protein